MSDYYNGINKVEDKQVKLQDIVYDWWGSLTEQRQWDIIEDHIGIENMNEETNPDEEYGNLSWDEQFGIYKDNNPKEFMSTNELYDGDVSSVDIADGEYEYNKENRRGI